MITKQLQTRLLLVFCAACIWSIAYAQSENTLMWFDAPNIILIGNGRLGGMVSGKVPTEVIVLNEDRIWSGSYNDPNPKGCAPFLPTVREHIWNDELLEAQNILQQNCMATPMKQQVYQTAGNISIATDHTGPITNYNHTLDLASAISTTTYTHGGVQYTRDAIANHPDNVIAIRLTANAPKSISFNLTYQTPMRVPTWSTSGSSISLSAMGTVREGLPGSIRFNVTAQVTASGGVLTTGGTAASTHLSVQGVDEATLVIAIHTNYIRYDDITADPHALVAETLEAVSENSFEDLVEGHVADYSALFGRLDISIGPPTPASYRSTTERRLLRNGPDPNMFALYTQFARYLAIASSRNTEPSNLQGLWNESPNPPWGSKHTININQQMNSWLVEPLNIAETLDPLWSLLRDMSERGVAIARDMYDIHRGWVGHHNTGIWRDSAPIDGAFYGVWPFGPTWLAQHMWDKYTYHPDPDSEFVRETAYPLMKGLTEFFLDYLVEDSDGYLVTNPSMSPEASIRSSNGTSISQTYGSFMDTALLRDLFNHTAEFAKILDVDQDFAANVTETMGRLMPFRIGYRGHLQEWAVDYPYESGHRHISHLYALFPSQQIDPRFNKTLVDAALTAIRIRGESDISWATTWRSLCYSRVLDGERALTAIDRLLKVSSYENLLSINGNVFQIDGNFGGAMAVTEMIIQSHNGEIHFLPALPASWPEGKISGFRVRGGFQLDMEWAGGKLVEATLTSTVGTFARVRYQGNAVDMTFERGEKKVLDENLAI